MSTETNLLYISASSDWLQRESMELRKYGFE